MPPHVKLLVRAVRNEWIKGKMTVILVALFCSPPPPGKFILAFLAAKYFPMFIK